MKNILTFLLLLSVWMPVNVQASELKEFETDYCTMFFEGTWRRPNVWKRCCYEHDLRYWFGGPKKEQKKADLILKQCVRRQAGSFWANLMYLAIRTGHFSPIKNKSRWGWGWKDGKFFRELTSEDKVYIRTKLEELDLDPEFLAEFYNVYEI